MSQFAAASSLAKSLTQWGWTRSFYSKHRSSAIYKFVFWCIVSLKNHFILGQDFLYIMDLQESCWHMFVSENGPVSKVHAHFINDMGAPHEITLQVCSFYTLDLWQKWSSVAQKTPKQTLILPWVHCATPAPFDPWLQSPSEYPALRNRNRWGYLGSQKILRHRDLMPGALLDLQEEGKAPATQTSSPDSWRFLKHCWQLAFWQGTLTLAASGFPPFAGLPGKFPCSGNPSEQPHQSAVLGKVFQNFLLSSRECK